jgi:excisionase family DNA binding protein
MSDESVKQAMGLADSLHGRSRALTVTDVATLLSVSPRQVYKLAAEHRIPCFKVGGSIRFDPVSIAGCLRQKMAPGSVAMAGEERRHA